MFVKCCKKLKKEKKKKRFLSGCVQSGTEIKWQIQFSWVQEKTVEVSDWRKNVEAMSGMEGRKKMFDAGPSQWDDVMHQCPSKPDVLPFESCRQTHRQRQTQMHAADLWYSEHLSLNCDSLSS